MLKRSFPKSSEGKLKINYFAKPSLHSEDFVIFDNTIKCSSNKMRVFLKTIGEKECYQFSDYDFITICACQFSIYKAFQVLGNGKLSGLTKQSSVRPQNLFSKECFQSALSDNLKKQLAAKLVAEIRQYSDAKIFIIVQPNPSKILTLENTKGVRFRNALANGSAGAIYLAFKNALTDYCQSQDNVEIIFQPDETIDAYIFTKLQYSSHSYSLHNLNEKHPKTDFLHANDRYGQLVWDLLEGAQAVKANE